MGLEKKHCVPCDLPARGLTAGNAQAGAQAGGGTPPLLKKDIDELLKQLKTSWEVIATERIQKHFEFPDFKEALAFVNQIGALAESEGHHPDIYLSWGEVSVELTTHAIGGLSQNDFILARKIEELYEGKGKNRVFI